MPKKKIRVAINGFGRIGRATFKIILKDFKDFEIVAINDLTDANTLKHLLMHDSCYGKFEKKVTVSANNLIIEKKKYPIYSQKDPSNLPWTELKVDLVLECSGRFRDKESANLHIIAGAKKVIISAPPKSSDINSFVIGVNEKKIKKSDKIVSCASCTTNCLAPVMKLIKEKFGIKKALMTTVHSYTADQNLVDGPHSDLRRARAAAVNIVPTTTGAAKATATVIPSLKDKFSGLALRVPTPVVSLCDVSILLKKRTTAKQVNEIFKQASLTNYKTIIEASEEELVSSDVLANSHSSVVDLKNTQVVDGDFLKLIVWYDNEWAYSYRLVQLINLMFK